MNLAEFVIVRVLSDFSKGCLALDAQFKFLFISLEMQW